MKTRTITLPSGQRMRVPENIQRLDGRGLAGWQVRYCGTRYFSDGQGSTRASLRLAMAELDLRVNKNPAPSRLKQRVKAGKLNAMPIGLSGPVVRKRRGALQCRLLVNLPRFGDIPKRATIYLGTENTYTAKRLEAAVVKGLAMREAALSAYRRQATIARRGA